MATKRTKKPPAKSRQTDRKATKNKALTKGLTPAQLDTAKSHVVESLKDAFSSEEVVEKFWQDLLPTLKTGNVKNRKTTKESVKIYRDALAVYGLDNHSPLSYTIPDAYRPLAIEFSRQLIQDYDCQTAGEKALAETIVSAYARILILSRQLNATIYADSIPLATNQVRFYSMLSKELDRANRHFTTALTTLIQLKSPIPNINIKAKTALVAQVQQFNMDKPESKTDEEIINPK